MLSPNREPSLSDLAEAAPPLVTSEVNVMTEASLGTLVSVGGVALNKRDLGLVLTNPERYHNIGSRFHEYGARQEAA